MFPGLTTMMMTVTTTKTMTTVTAMMAETVRWQLLTVIEMLVMAEAAGGDLAQAEGGIETGYNDWLK